MLWSLCLVTWLASLLVLMTERLRQECCCIRRSFSCFNFLSTDRVFPLCEVEVNTSGNMEIWREYLTHDWKCKLENVESICEQTKWSCFYLHSKGFSEQFLGRIFNFISLFSCYSLFDISLSVTELLNDHWKPGSKSIVVNLIQIRAHATTTT